LRASATFGLLAAGPRRRPLGPVLRAQSRRDPAQRHAGNEAWTPLSTGNVGHGAKSYTS
jgi:hypothetical protein